MVSGMQPLLKARIVFFVYFRHNLLNMKNCSGRIVQKKSSDIEEDIKISGGKAKMKYVRQIGIILGITLAGEFLNKILPLPVPAGVYGLFLMLAALITGVVKLESVEGTGNFLMDTMSMMFVPATVGILECADELKAVLIPFLIIIAVSTVVVMIVTGKIAQFMMESAEKKKEK